MRDALDERAAVVAQVRSGLNPANPSRTDDSDCRVETEI